MNDKIGRFYCLILLADLLREIKTKFYCGIYKNWPILLAVCHTKNQLIFLSSDKIGRYYHLSVIGFIIALCCVLVNVTYFEIKIYELMKMKQTAEYSKTAVTDLRWKSSSVDSDALAGHHHMAVTYKQFD